MKLLVFPLVLLAPLVAPALADDLSLPPGIKNSQDPKDQPLAPQEALRRITLPEGFHATLFAGEPQVRQPIAMALDDRGRLWVAECYAYRDWKPEGRDRILILEDTDGDGEFDTRRVFWDRGNYVTGLAVGFGGVWVCSTPNFLFIPDRDGDDVPDGEPQVLLDGWSTEGVHNVPNGLTWGPDGWLYGANGITSPSLVGRPGTPDEDRVEMSCGIWRYHPTRHEFEVVARGTTNPWGLDYDQHGQFFFTNCVIGHLWHMIPGAHYRRMFGEDSDPYVYGLIEQCADHLHWAGDDWTKSRGGEEHDKLGGGHAHAGALIYQGNNWPAAYRGTLFTCNIHGNRVNNDRLAREGSGYAGRHAEDFMLANDPWFRGLELLSGPDGGVYISDWTDLGECHDKDGVHRDSGRIYKVVYGKTEPIRADLAGKSDVELVALLRHENSWHNRHARRLLQERAAGGKLSQEALAALAKMLDGDGAAPIKLRAIWALHATGGLSEAELEELLADRSEHVRWWAVQLLAEDGAVSPAAMKRFEEMAAGDESALVRLSLASALQRLPEDDRWEIAGKLAGHAEDADDHNLPLMIWFAIEPLAAKDPSRAARLAAASKIPLLIQYVARRIAER